jgi:hypothetical protein
MDHRVDLPAPIIQRVEIYETPRKMRADINYSNVVAVQNM